MLIAGGEAAGGVVQSSAEIYDPSTGTYTLTGPMLEPRTLSRDAVLVDDRVLIAGGQPEAGLTEKAEIYDPVTGTFSTTGTLFSERTGAHNMITLASGKVLVAGGTSLAPGPRYELYDPLSGFFNGFYVRASTSNPTLSLLPNGSAFSLGNSPEIVNPETQVVSTFPGAGRLERHAAVTLEDQRVLVFGGFHPTAGDSVPSRAYLYYPNGLPRPTVARTVNVKEVSGQTLFSCPRQGVFDPVPRKVQLRVGCEIERPGGPGSSSLPPTVEGQASPLLEGNLPGGPESQDRPHLPEPVRRGDLQRDRQDSGLGHDQQAETAEQVWGSGSRPAHHQWEQRVSRGAGHDLVRRGPLQRHHFLQGPQRRGGGSRLCPEEDDQTDQRKDLRRGPEEMVSDTEGQRVDSADVLGHSLETILAEASNPEDSLASGSAAALAVALAAALTCSAARSLESSVEASGFVIQAENLRMRAVELVEQNRGHYEAARGALEDRLKDPGYRDHRIGVAMKDTLDTLGLIAGTGADTAELAANVAGIATAETRPDAVSATSLAEAGTQVATILITANLLSSSGGEAQAAAESELAAASAASGRARALLG